MTSEEDRAALEAGLRDAFADLSPRERVRADLATPSGWDRSLWSRLCGELGLAGLAVPEELGGSGATLAEAGLALHEAGAALLCAPLLSTVALALPQLLASGDVAACIDLVPRIVSGEVVATFAVSDLDGTHPPAQPVGATEAGDGWRLDGAAGYVVDGAFADVVLVPASTPSGVGLFAVDGSAAGLRREPLVTLDLTRRAAHVHLERTPARLVGAPDAATAIATGLDDARALLACEMVGGAGRALDMTVDYARERIQFGRPIGSFQAIKAKLADLLIAVESARSAALHAVATTGDERPVASRIAHATCAETFQQVTAAAIQLHGGIGFTWEHDIHLYFKRARASAVLLGTASQDYDVIAEHLAETYA